MVKRAVNHYRRGVAVEYLVRNLLKKEGWAVIRGAGSKGYWWCWKPDLIASRPRERRGDGLRAVCEAFVNDGWVIEPPTSEMCKRDFFHPERVALKVTRGGTFEVWIRTMVVVLEKDYPLMDQVLLQVKRGGRGCTSHSTHNTSR